MMKMVTQKYYRMCCLFSLSLTLSSLYSDAHAELGTYNFTLSGNVTLSTCGVTQGTENMQINMGRMSIKNLKSPGDKSPRVAIPFNLVQCPANAQVTFTFVGTQNAVDKQLLALSNANATTTAKHAAIEMTDRDRNRIPISIAGGQSNKSQPLLADANGNLSVIFYANYIATDASATAGSANANAVFLIEYQ